MPPVLSYISLDPRTLAPTTHTHPPAPPLVDAAEAADARYARHAALPAFGRDQQLCVAAASVLVIGAGGLGSPAILYLAAAGVGRLGIADGDTLERSNLQRQILHRDADVGRRKVLSALEAVMRLNPAVGARAVGYDLRVDATNAIALIRPFGVIVDCTDNSQSRYAINAACAALGRPLVSAAALRWEGHVTVFVRGPGASRAPCLRCVFGPPAPPNACGGSCADDGVLGPVPGVLGAIQAAEAIKLAAGLDTTLAHALIHYDGRAQTCRRVELRGRCAWCPDCGDQAIAMPGSAESLRCDVAPSVDIQAALDDVRANPGSRRLLDIRAEDGGELRDDCVLRLSGSAALERADELGGLEAVYVLCHRGVSSVAVVAGLRERGVRAVHVRGGFSALAV